MSGKNENKGFIDLETEKTLEILADLPHKILKNHELHNLSQLVLHEMGHNGCFGFQRAVYLIDNPDFDHLVGATGFCNKECPCHENNLWSDPAKFSSDMKDAKFNIDSRKILKNSLRKKDINLDDSEDILELGKVMGICEPQFFSWHMKHGNHGILIFGKNKQLSQGHKKLLSTAAAMLGFCGI